MIEVSELHFSYDGYKVIKGIDLEVGETEKVAVIGRNGVGKTTLLKLISGILAPDRGRVEIDSENVTSIPVRDRARKMSVVEQRTPDARDFTVFEVLLTGRFPYSSIFGYSSRDYKFVEEILKSFNLIDYQDRIFSTLSKGEQKRVLLGRALVQDAPIILLDEPTSELDIKYQNELLKTILKEADKKEKTVISVMHDLVLATRYFERLLLLDEGLVVADGEPEAVITAQNLRKAYRIEADITWYEDEPVIRPAK